MNNNIDLLAMDFDGVIADSIMECAVSGYNGFAKFTNSSKYIVDPNEIDETSLLIFQRMRPFIRSGEDYIYLFQALIDKVTIGNQNDFDDFKAEHIDRKIIYHDYFYSSREELFTNHFSKWMELNPLYNGMKIFLNSISIDFHIISSKASKYINEILLQNNISIKDKNVHSTEDGLDKIEILQNIMSKNNYNAVNTYYIDDHLDTLIKMNKSKVNCLLAMWGYNNNNLDEYSELKINMISLEDFYRSFNIL